MQAPKANLCFWRYSTYSFDFDVGADIPAMDFRYPQKQNEGLEGVVAQ